MKISIFGLGYVGLVSGACLAKLGHEVTGVDVSTEKIDMVNKGISPIVEEGIAELVRDMVAAGRLRGTIDATEAIATSELSLVSVGTPSAENGALRTDALEAVSRAIGTELRRKRERHVVCYRSTMLPGTLEKRLIPILAERSGRSPGEGFDVCYNPEFLREGSSIKDFEKPPYTIVGAKSDTCFDVMEQVYRGVNAPFVRTTYRVAESVKFMSNIFHAVKICFANEIGALLGTEGIDSREAAAIFMMDGILNTSKAYLRPGFAFGGSCLPKDLRAILALARETAVDMPMLSNILPSNQRHVDRAFSLVTQGGRRRIALFGLAFKNGTDDLRESPFVSLAEKLIGRGYPLRIFDPNVQQARLLGANKEFIEREIPHFGELLQPTAEETLRGAEVVVVGHADAATVDAILRQSGDAPIFDLQGIERIQQEAPRRYRGICW